MVIVSSFHVQELTKMTITNYWDLNATFGPATQMKILHIIFLWMKMNAYGMMNAHDILDYLFEQLKKVKQTTNNINKAGNSL